MQSHTAASPVITEARSTNASWDIIPCKHNRGSGWEFCCGVGCCEKLDSPRYSLGNITNVYGDKRYPETPSSTSISISFPTGQPTSICTSSSTVCPTPDYSKVKVQYGTGLGVGLGVPLLISMALLFLQYRRRNDANQTYANIPVTPKYDHTVYQTVNIAEVSGLQHAKYEMPPGVITHELPDELGRR
ncbi:hypothetical protein B0J11DRAFT_570193 [Dendryphion nanum]|uniref:Uncharacterized protein n=1 Tax=Dendryphion nanum TaxID=256645 RepID=A0A9P9DHX5_9PLEO|nr:hypothetical protein B0J11DRAFT_570193 [Dendryphion nanum]